MIISPQPPPPYHLISTYMMVIWHAARSSHAAYCSCLPHPALAITLSSAAAVVAVSPPLLGCAFRFFCSGSGPASFFGSSGFHGLLWIPRNNTRRNRIIPGQGNINLFRRIWNSGQNSGGKDPFYATCNKHSVCGLMQHKKQVSQWHSACCCYRAPPQAAAPCCWHCCHCLSRVSSGGAGVARQRRRWERNHPPHRCSHPLLLACPPHQHRLSPFRRPLLILQPAAHLSTTLPTTVGCCVGTPPFHRRNRNKSNLAIIVHLCHCPPPCSGRLTGGTITSQQIGQRRHRTSRRRQPTALRIACRRLIILLASSHQPLPSMYLGGTTSLHPRMLIVKSSCCSIAERTSDECSISKSGRRGGNCRRRPPPGRRSPSLYVQTATGRATSARICTQ